MARLQSVPDAGWFRRMQPAAVLDVLLAGSSVVGLVVGYQEHSGHLLRVIDHVESYDRLLTDVLNAHLAQISVQQNSDMRKISAWVAIAAVPTMLAGIEGMNFEHMPELRHVWGYPAVLALMVVSCLALYRAFRRSGWL